MSFLPKTRTERFIAVCFLVAVLSVGGGIFLTESDLPNGVPNKLQEILWGAASLGLICATPAMTILGILRARRDGFSYKTWRMPILGLALCFCEQTLATIRESSELLTKAPRFYEGIDPETYSNLSKNAAAYRYLYIGEIREYETSGGNRKMYEPTEDDKRSHEIMTVSKTVLAKTREAMDLLMYAWTACAFLSAIFGIFWPLGKQLENSI